VSKKAEKQKEQYIQLLKQARGYLKSLLALRDVVEADINRALDRYKETSVEKFCLNNKALNLFTFLSILQEYLSCQLIVVQNEFTGRGFFSNAEEALVRTMGEVNKLRHLLLPIFEDELPDWPEPLKRMKLETKLVVREETARSMLGRHPSTK